MCSGSVGIRGLAGVSVHVASDSVRDGFAKLAGIAGKRSSDEVTGCIQANGRGVFVPMVTFQSHGLYGIVVAENHGGLERHPQSDTDAAT